jgi:hypothetical protein
MTQWQPFAGPSFTQPSSRTYEGQLTLNARSPVERPVLAQMRPQLMSAVPLLLEHERTSRCIVAL